MGGNTATLITITKESTSCRPLHYTNHAGRARDQVGHQPIKVSHQPDKALPADGLTKVLQGTALKKTRIQLTRRNGHDDQEELEMHAREW